jgi:glycosyltransferase involved in cell wall biosynthesis
MKKVLIFSLAYYPHVGGAEVAIKEITDRISDIEFHMVTMRFDAESARMEKIGNITVHRVGSGSSYISKILYVPRAAFFAQRLHNAEHFNAWWAMMSYMAFPVSLLRLFGDRTPYVLTLQDGDPFEHVFKRWYIRLVSPFLYNGFRRATVIQTISTFLVRWARQSGFTGLVEVVPNAVDTKRFLGEPIAHQGTRLITTSRLVRKNGIDLVIKALAHLPKDVRFKILGIGTDYDALKVLAVSLRVSDRVEFAGHVDHAQLPAALHGADIFVRPSRSEGMGNSFIEAFAAGIPVIATQEGGIADFLFDAKRNPGKEPTGWAVDTESPEQIAEAVQSILANPEETKKVVEHARRLAIEKYDWNLIARDMRQKVFAKVLD